MALRARRHFSSRRHLVRIRQWETGGAVIKRRVQPASRIMASRALRSREACRHVIRYISTQGLRALPCRLVTSIAIRVRGRQRVIVVDVAIRAGIHLPRRRQLVRTR